MCGFLRVRGSGQTQHRCQGVAVCQGAWLCPEDGAVDRGRSCAGGMTVCPGRGRPLRAGYGQGAGTVMEQGHCAGGVAVP